MLENRCLDSRGRLERPIAFDSQMHSKDLAVSRYDHVTLIVKAQTDDSNARDCHFGLRIGCDLDDTAMTTTARGHVDIALSVERQALRSAQAREESRHFALRADSHN